MLLKNQKGFSVFGIVAGLMLVALLMSIGPKIGMPYYNAHVIERAISEAIKLVPVEAAPITARSKIKENVNARLAINNISIDLDFLSVDKDGDTITVEYEHVESYTLWDGVEIVVTRPIIVSSSLEAK